MLCRKTIVAYVNTIIFFFFLLLLLLHGLDRLTCSGIDALPSFLRSSTISSSSRFVVEGVFRKSGVVHSFKIVDPVLISLVFQEWRFRGWVGKPPKENKILISKDAQPWISM
jgi:hypothetical protein